VRVQLVTAGVLLLRLGLLAGFASCVVSAAGCALIGARSQVARVHDLRIIQGTVSGSEGDPVVAVAIREPEASVEDFFQLDGDGSYMLLVSPGHMRLAAFRDRNGDLVRQRDEPAVVLHPERAVEIRERVRYRGFDGILPRTADPSLDLAVDLSNSDLDTEFGLGGPPAGTLARLSDDRFSRANGDKGLWRPADFLVDPGGGVFFLEPFDPDRTPVLFVHGIAGTPKEFQFLIDELDRESFQPWVLHYPSALRLETVADFLHLSLRDLRDRLGFERVFLVAHSMGGLIARAALDEFREAELADAVPLLVSLSTPWSGHAAAAAGVQRSPVVLPAWRDMKPGSAFLNGLMETPLSEEVEFHLFFGFEGHRAFKGTGGTNDGVVAMASQLAAEAQRDAERLWGFPANHTDILRRHDVAEALNAVLARNERLSKGLFEELF
jgi:pimeloyl-ACP methyl ester carboxylesterase